MVLQLALDSNGWSVIPAINTGDGAKEIWCDESLSTGLNNGSSKENAYQTLAAACAAVTDGKGDHIILVEGVTYTGNFNNLAGKSGASVTDPIIIYPENWDVDGAAAGRPIISANDNLLSISSEANKIENVAFIGFESTQPDFVGLSGQNAFNITGPSADARMLNVLFEDLYIHDRSGLTFGPTGSADVTPAFLWDFLARRCTFARIYSQSTDQSICLTRHANKVTWYECNFIRGGFHPSHNPRTNRVRAQYNTISTENIEFIRCGFFDGASADQMRAGPNLVKQCLFEHSLNLLNIGYQGGPEGQDLYEKADGFVSTCVDSVFMDGVAGGVNGIQLKGSMSAIGKSLVFKNCILNNDAGINSNSGGLQVFALESNNITNPRVLDNGMHNVLIEDCIIHRIAAEALYMAFKELSGSPSPSTGTVTNVRVKNNIITGHNGISNPSFIRFDAWPSAVGLAADAIFSGNQYYHYDFLQTNTNLFTNDNDTNINFDDWKANYEADATWVDPEVSQFTDPNRFMPDYYTDVMGQTTSGVDDDGTDATGTVTMSGVTAGDTVTIHDVVYTGVNGTPADLTEFQVDDASGGGTDENAATSLVAAMTGGPGNSQRSSATSSGAVVTIVPPEHAGAYGNLIELEESTSGARIIISGATLTGGVDGDRKLMYDLIETNRKGKSGGWDSNLMAPAIIDWVFAGFGKASLENPPTTLYKVVQ